MVITPDRYEQKSSGRKNAVLRTPAQKPLKISKLIIFYSCKSLLLTELKGIILVFLVTGV